MRKRLRPRAGPAHRHRADQGGDRQFVAAVGEPAEAVSHRTGTHRPAGRTRRPGDDLRPGTGRRPDPTYASDRQRTGTGRPAGPQRRRHLRPGGGEKPPPGRTGTGRRPPTGRTAQRGDPARWPWNGPATPRNSRSADCGWSAEYAIKRLASTVTWRWPNRAPARPRQCVARPRTRTGQGDHHQRSVTRQPGQTDRLAAGDRRLNCRSRRNSARSPSAAATPPPSPACWPNSTAVVGALRSAAVQRTDLGPWRPPSWPPRLWSRRGPGRFQRVGTSWAWYGCSEEVQCIENSA